MRFRLLDLFCGAGGCSVGYHRAGFEVVGVDHHKMPRYPYEFHQSDALEFLAAHGREFDAVHASPPCQKYCALRHLAKKDHPDLIPQTRALLRETGLPYVIENVPGAPLLSPVMLCGTMFGLRTDCGAELRRHRLFETNWPLMRGLKCRHYVAATSGVIGVYGDHPRPGNEFTERAKEKRFSCTEIVHGHSGGNSRRDGYDPTIAGHTPEDRKGRVIGVYGDRPKDGSERTLRQTEKRTICVNGTGLTSEGRSVITITGSTPQQNIVRNIARKTFPVSAARVAMGIDWMTMKELSQAIPPAYCEFIGRQLRQWLLSERAETEVAA